MSPAPVPFARMVDLQGTGPFLLPRMKGVVSFGNGTWDWPTVRFESLEGQDVLVPLAAEAINALKVEIQAWLRLPLNPLNQ